jgi:IS30 family transposase
MIGTLNAGEYSSAELGDLFGVARSTVYRAVERDAARERAQRQMPASIR